MMCIATRLFETLGLQKVVQAVEGVLLHIELFHHGTLGVVQGQLRRVARDAA